MTARGARPPRVPAPVRESGFARDRAAIVTGAILQIARQALLRWLYRDGTNMAGARGEIEAILRDEFSDIARETRNEIRRDDE
jgi:hypothetical protein